MTVTIRLTQKLYQAMLLDLQRPSTVSYERVGFIFARPGSLTPKEKLLLFTEYIPVLEEDYIADQGVGARINGAAIRRVMQKILDTESCAFHVHLHPFLGKPQLSNTDMAGILPLVPSFQAVGPTLPHGILLLGSNDAICHVWYPGNHTSILANKISIIGYPLTSYV